MSNDHRRSVLTFVSLLPVVVILLAMILDIDGDPLTKWIQKWETLLAAMIASLAAGLTIGQMRISDSEQWRIHRQSMRVALRSEIQRMQRATDEVERINDNLQRFAPDVVKGLEAWPGELDDDAGDRALAIGMAVCTTMAKTYTDSADIAAARADLPPHAYLLYRNSLYFASQFLEAIELLKRVEIGDRPGLQSANLLRAFAGGLADLSTAMADAMAAYETEA